MQISKFLESLSGIKIDGQISVVRITNTTKQSLPISLEPWAYTKIVESGNWLDVVVVGHKSLALDVHYLPDEVIAYTETGTSVRVFDHFGENQETGWDDKSFPSPSDFP